LETENGRIDIRRIQGRSFGHKQAGENQVADDPIRDVTRLMMVRHMPDDDFMALCNAVLKSKGSALDADEDMGHYGTPRDVMGQHGTVCSICGEAAPEAALTSRVEALAGLTACKRCIDAALLGLTTGRAKPGSLAAQLSVIFRARRKSPRGERHAHRVDA
jgi:hypothetical protein